MSSESKPLLGENTNELTESNRIDDLLGLDLSGNDDSDALLLELASLDLEHTTAEKEFASETTSTNPNLTSLQGESFLANFEKVFGTTEMKSEEWSQFLPSHFLSNNAAADDFLLLSNPCKASESPLEAFKETNEKNLSKGNATKKVYSFFLFCKWHKLNLVLCEGYWKRI